MKKSVCLLLILAVLLSFASCGGGYYEPVPSTDEEREAVMTILIDGESYNVNYELYRAMFITYKGSVDGGDSSVWQGEDKEEYIERVHGLIMKRVTDIYAALHLCKTLEIDLYSSEVETQIKEYVKVSVEGGVFNDVTVTGYPSYDEYLKALAELGMNYAVQELIFRYSIALDKIYAHYVGTITDENFDSSLTGGALEYTRDDVRSFYFSSDCQRFMRAFVQSQYSGAYERAFNLRSEMLLADNDEDVAIAIISKTTAVYDEVLNGTVIGRSSLYDENYRALTDAVFATAVGQVSDIVEITAGEEPGYYIVYPIEKNESHFDEYYADIALVYIENEIGIILDGIQQEMTENAVGTSVLSELDYSKIGTKK